MSDDGKPVGAGASPDGSEHDAWLREALRHAPDASAAPPPTLRDAILAEARAAARGTVAPRAAATPSLVDRVLEFWSWLARPQVAAGFASVMAATLVGMLWWDRPMEETMLPPPASPPVAAAPAAPAEAAKQAPAGSDRLQEATVPPVAPTVAAPPLRDAAPAPAKTAPLPSAREADAAAAPRTERQERAREAADERSATPADAKARIATEAEKAERKDRAAKLDGVPAPSVAIPKATSPTNPPAPSPATQAAPAAAPAAPTAPAAPAVPSPFPARAPSDDETGASRRPAPRPAPPPPPSIEAAAPAPIAPQPGAAAGRAEPFSLAKKAESGDKEGAAARSAAPAPAVRAPAQAGALGRSSSLDSSAEASASGRVAAQNAAEAVPRQAPSTLAAVAQRPMAPLLAALASEDARWSRRLASGDNVAVDAPVRAWLAQVQAAAPRWEQVTDRTARRDALASAMASATLLLERDGRSAAIVRIEDGGVFFDPVTGPAGFAPLPAEVVARLRASLPAATR